MALADKLSNLSAIKEDIREAINLKGQEVSSELPFNQYADKIRAIRNEVWDESDAPERDPLLPSIEEFKNILRNDTNTGTELEWIDSAEDIEKHLLVLDGVSFRTFNPSNLTFSGYANNNYKYYYPIAFKLEDGSVIGYPEQTSSSWSNFNSIYPNGFYIPDSCIHDTSDPNAKYYYVILYTAKQTNISNSPILMTHVWEPISSYLLEVYASELRGKYKSPGNMQKRSTNPLRVFECLAEDSEIFPEGIQVNSGDRLVIFSSIPNVTGVLGAACVGNSYKYTPTSAGQEYLHKYLESGSDYAESFLMRSESENGHRIIDFSKWDDEMAELSKFFGSGSYTSKGKYCTRTTGIMDFTNRVNTNTLYIADTNDTDSGAGLETVNIILPKVCDVKIGRSEYLDLDYGSLKFLAEYAPVLETTHTLYLSIPCRKKMKNMPYNYAVTYEGVLYINLEQVLRLKGWNIENAS